MTFSTLQKVLLGSSVLEIIIDYLWKEWLNKQRSRVSHLEWGPGEETEWDRLWNNQAQSWGHTVAIKGRKPVTVLLLFIVLGNPFCVSFWWMERGKEVTNEVDLSSLENREAYILSNHCHYKTLLSITECESLCYWNKQQIPLRIGRKHGQDGLSKEVEKAAVPHSDFPYSCIACYFRTIYLLVTSNPLFYKWQNWDPVTKKWLTQRHLQCQLKKIRARSPF